jgi:membrane-bound ClpP family serine protease
VPIKNFFRKLVLNMGETPERGYVAAKPGLKDYLGKTGIAKTTLRPSGTAIFDGELVDVVTLGEFLEAGTEILVTSVEGMRVIVKENPKEL